MTQQQASLLRKMTVEGQNPKSSKWFGGQRHLEGLCEGYFVFNCILTPHQCPSAFSSLWGNFPKTLKITLDGSVVGCCLLYTPTFTPIWGVSANLPSLLFVYFYYYLIDWFKTETQASAACPSFPTNVKTAPQDKSSGSHSPPWNTCVPPVTKGSESFS